MARFITSKNLNLLDHLKIFLIAARLYVDVWSTTDLRLIIKLFLLHQTYFKDFFEK